jgi:hypothetical protein
MLRCSNAVKQLVETPDAAQIPRKETSFSGISSFVAKMAQKECDPGSETRILP